MQNTALHAPTSWAAAMLLDRVVGAPRLVLAFRSLQCGGMLPSTSCSDWCICPRKYTEIHGNTGTAAAQACHFLRWLAAVAAHCGLLPGGLLRAGLCIFCRQLRQAAVSTLGPADWQSFGACEWVLACPTPRPACILASWPADGLIVSARCVFDAMVHDDAIDRRLVDGLSSKAIQQGKHPSN